jgi:hypothetical protein
MPRSHRSRPLASVAVAIVVCAVAVGAPTAAPAAEQGDQQNARRIATRGIPVRVVNDTLSPLPVVNVGPVEIIGPMFDPKQILIQSLDFPGTEESAAVSLPAVQEWLVLEVEVVPLPAVDTQKPPAPACVLEVEVPKEEVNSNSNEPNILSVGWSGLDFRSFHRPLAIPLKRRLGETIELLLQAVGGDGSVRSPCRAKVVLRGVTR